MVIPVFRFNAFQSFVIHVSQTFSSGKQKAHHPPRPQKCTFRKGPVIRHHGKAEVSSFNNRPLLLRLSIRQCALVQALFPPSIIAGNITLLRPDSEISGILLSLPKSVKIINRIHTIPVLHPCSWRAGMIEPTFAEEQAARLRVYDRRIKPIWVGSQTTCDNQVKFIDKCSKSDGDVN